MQLLYIHGFNSSPASHKARVTREWLASNAPETGFICPLLSPVPPAAMGALEAEIQNRPGDTFGLVGSSMGGFYATYLSEKYGFPAVLINPAVYPWRGRDYLLGEQVNYHTGETTEFTREHLESFRQFEVGTLSHPERLRVMVQTGDEVLDYRLAVEKYRDCRLLIEEGGDHGFQNYQRHLPAIMKFIGSTDVI